MTLRTLTAALAAWALLGGAAARAAEPAPAPASFDERFQAARALAFGGQREQAIAAYTQLLDESPGNADVLLGRGRVHAWMGHWPLAEADLLAATRAAPRYGDAWSALGDLYLWSDRPAMAAEAWGQWLAVAAPDDPAPLLARARAWRALGDRAAARADYQAAAARGADSQAIQAGLDSLEAPIAGVATRFPEAPIAPREHRWTASVGIDRNAFSGGGPAFTDSSATLRRQWDQGSLAFEALATQRFGSSDQAYALDGYVDAWPRAYANLRYQFSPGERLFPRTRWRAELFQGVGRGWELSAGYDQLDFASHVRLESLGVGRYFGNWYVRLRHLHVPGTASDPSSSDSDRLVARYYYAGDAARYVEAYAGGGRSEPPSTVSPTATARNSWSLGAAWAVPIGTRLGLRIGAGGGHGLESEPWDYANAYASLYTQW